MREGRQRTGGRNLAGITSRGPQLGLFTAVVGLFLAVMGYLSAVHPLTPWYRDPLAGYDPPFDFASGLLLLALSLWIRERSSVAWLFSILAPLLSGAIAILSPNPYSVAAAVAAALLVAAIQPRRALIYRGEAVGPEATQIAFLAASILSVLFGVVGSRWLGAQFTPNVHGWVESLYFTVATISTIGSIYQPITDVARAFSVVLILVGVGTFLSAIVVLFGPILEGRLRRIAERLERAQMQELEHHVIVCGTGPEALATARALRVSGVPSVVLSSDARHVDLLKGEGGLAHLGDPSSEEDLGAVGIERARALVAAQDSDAANLLTVITARSLQPQLRIIALAAAESTLAKFLRAGATEAISVVSVAAQLISQAAIRVDPIPDSPPGVPAGPRSPRGNVT